MNFLVVDPPHVQLTVENERPTDTTMRLSNISDDEMIFFKVRIAAPSRYCVQPTRGVIWPKSFTMVSITCSDLHNPPEVGTSDDVFAIHNFRMKFTDVALRNSNLDASTAYTEFEKQHPKPKVNELRLKVCFVAEKPIDYKEEYLKLNQDMAKVENDRKTDAEQLDAVRAELAITNEARTKLMDELDAVRAELGVTDERELVKELADIKTAADEEGRKLQEELAALRRDADVGRELQAELAAVRTLLVTANEGRIKVEEEMAAVRTAADEGERKLQEELADVRTAADEGGRKLQEELAAVRTAADERGRKLQEELAAVRTATDEGGRKLQEELLMIRADNESMMLLLNLMQKDVIICNEDKERFKRERDNQEDNQEKERVIMEKERDAHEKIREQLKHALF